MADDGPGRYVDTFAECRRLEAGNALISRECEQLESLLRPGSSIATLMERLQSLDPPSRRSLAGAIEQTSRPALNDLRDASSRVEKQIGGAKAAWRATRVQIEHGRSLLFQVQGSRRLSGQLASLVSSESLGVWLCGLGAALALAAVIVHDKRHDLRRLRKGFRVGGLGLSKALLVAVFVLGGVCAAVWLLGSRMYEAVLSAGTEEVPPRQTAEAEAADLDAELRTLTEARKKLDARREGLLSSAAEKIAAGLDRETAAAPWREFRDESLRVAERLAVLEGIVEAAQSDQIKLDQVNADLAAQAEAAAEHLRVRQWVRTGLGLALLTAIAVGMVLVRRTGKRRETKVTETCPLCLGTIRSTPGPKPGSNGQAGPGVVRCENLISHEPKVECGYVFRDVYRPMPKLCFPTLGVPKAGKTHWLAMLYWQLNRGNYPKSVRFERIKRAGGDGGEDFDATVEQILYSRIGTAATQRDRVPHPVVFNFEDHDRWGHSNLLVNIFDYSGEVTLDMGVDDYRRRRALEADGFFFFLDPTYPAEPQTKALADFREDLRLVKGIRAGREVRVPVALCVPKIDLLAAQPYALPDGTDAVGRFYEDLACVDPTGEAMTLDVMRARSELVARLRDTIWPGWQIERTIHDLFGGRYLFFPLTPVGLDGRGEADLSLRTIAPFGLLEPLLWLLEMNGYPVLD